VSHYRGLHSVPEHLDYNGTWTIFLQIFWISAVSVIPPVLHSPTSFINHQQYITIAMGSVFKQSNKNTIKPENVMTVTVSVSFTFI
jgi:hypothetical protein